VHPGALGFETDLNGSGLTSSYTYGYTHQKQNEFALSMAYGYFGAGWEKLQDTGRDFSRFSFALGTPLSSQLFLGTRFSFTSSDTATLSGVHSWDMGVQYRPFSFFSLGLMANHLNETTVAGAPEPIQWVAGATVKPFDRLELSFDADTFSNHFGKRFGYQASGRFEILSGLQVYGGYNRDYKTNIGIHFDLAQTRIFSFAAPQNSTNGAKFTVGFQTAMRPHPSFATPKTTLEVLLDGDLSEEHVEGTLFSKGTYSLFDVLQTLEDAGKENSIKNIYVRIEKFPLGLAAAGEIHEALLKLREQGKEIDATIGNGGATEYLIASAANRIHMEPNGELRLLGPRSERFYAKGTLDKIGMEGEFLARGEYKSAPETFTRKDSSPKSREATLHELKKIEEEYAALLSQSRKISLSDYRKVLGHAIFSAKNALDFRLVDSITPARDVEEKLKERSFFRSSAVAQEERLNLPSRIAVITAQGNILKKKVRLFTFAGEPQITPERFERHLEKALRDARTKAIVVRVSSPGGEVLASQEIASLLESAKKKKPIFVSMGDYAASGGYMISAPAEAIFADPMTATGSIGVFLGKVSLEGLYKKIDLHKEIISQYPYAGIFSEGRSWNAEERTVMLRTLDQYYDGFVSQVARLRRLKKEEAEAAAKGRVWLGDDALQRKLIDKKGGLMAAIQFAREKIGVAEKDVETWPIIDSFGLFSMLENGGMTQAPSTIEGFAGLFISPEAGRSLDWMASLREQPFLYWEPTRLIP
jgi:protease IV